MTVKDYTGIKAVKRVSPVSDEDVRDYLDQFRKSNPKTVPVYRPAAAGDTVTIDFAGFCDGVQFEGGTAENYRLVLGSGRFVPGFEDQLAGTVAGDKVDVKITFPENYTPQLAGKDAVFKCTVKAVEKEVERQLDDDLAVEVFGMKDLEECLARARQSLEQNAETEANEKALEEILDVICAANPWDPAEEDIAEEIGALIDAMAMQMSGRQMKREDFYQLSGLSEADFREGLYPTARRNLHVKELLTAIARQEGILVTDEDREGPLTAMAQRFGMDFETFTKSMGKEMLDPDILMDKVMQFLLDSSLLETVNE